MNWKIMFFFLGISLAASALCLGADGFVPLFDGKTLAGWKPLSGGRWEVVAPKNLDKLDASRKPLEEADELPFIHVDARKTTAFYEVGSGRSFVPIGLNYFGPHMGWAPQLWRRFDPQTIRRHLNLVRGQGFNTIRLFLTFESFHHLPGQVDAEGLSKFRELVAICRELEIRIVPSGPDHWEGVPEWRRQADPFADEAVLQADEAWWEAFTALFQDEPVILAWDLLNEPAIGWSSPAMKTHWNGWLERKYGSIERVAQAHAQPLDQATRFGQIAVPPPVAARNDTRLYDYQLFREWIADQWTRRLVAAVRRGDSRHPVTIGHIQWAGTSYLPGVRHYAGFHLKENARHLDFLTIHFYPLAPPKPCDAPEGIDRNADYLEALLNECSAGKPVMIGEFGWYGGGDIRVGDHVTMPEQTLEDQVAWNTRLLQVSRGRVCGWLNWAFADTPASQDLTRWSGLWTEDLGLKPWGKAFGQFARDHVAKPLEVRPFPDRLTRVAPDRKAVLTDPQSTALPQ
jgi:hypothetical protein